MSQSEIMCLRRRIELECEAMQRALTDVAVGAARHEFIRAHMERLGNHQDMLATCIGESEAARLVVETCVKVMEK